MARSDLVWSRTAAVKEIKYNGKVRIHKANNKFIKLEFEVIQCPRCESPMAETDDGWGCSMEFADFFTGFVSSDSVETEIKQAVDASIYTRLAIFEIECACSDDHKGRPDDIESGCGQIVDLAPIPE